MDINTFAKYFFVFAAAFVEGPFVALGVGFFIRLEYISFIPAFIALLLGDFIPDTIYYYIGRFGNRNSIFKKYGKYLRITERHELALEKLWLHHGKKTMFFGKLAYGLSIPFLISAGLAKLPPYKFWLYAVPVTIFQYGLLTFLGYYFGESYKALIESYVINAEIAIAVAVIIFIIIFILLRKTLTKYTNENFFSKNE